MDGKEKHELNTSEDLPPSQLTGFIDEQVSEALVEYEQELVASGMINDDRRLIHNRLQWLIRGTGAVLLALNVAIVSILGNFIVVNMVLHLKFSEAPADQSFWNDMTEYMGELKDRLRE